jgi:Putative DNA-binding domain
MSSQLRELQQRMAACVMQPLTREEGMRRGNEREAEAIIRPNDRLSSFERLEIYNRQYWFRVFSSFEEDFPGLQAVVGNRRFQKLMRDYLTACPSTSFSLRNLGSRLVAWLQQHPAYTEPRNELALEMAALEWAHIETFDNAEWPRLAPEQMATVGEESQLTLQPYLQLIEAHYAIDDALIALRHENGSSAGSSNNASTGHVLRRTRSLRSLPRQLLYLALHRYEDSVYYRRIAREDYQLLRAIRRGAPLGDALEAAFENSEIPETERPAYLQSAFGYYSAMGWFCSRPPDPLE